MPVSLSSVTALPVALSANTRLLFSKDGVVSQRISPGDLITKQTTVGSLAADVSTTSNVTFSNIFNNSVVAGKTYWVSYAIRYTLAGAAALTVRTAFAAGAVGTKHILHTGILSDTDTATCYNLYDSAATTVYTLPVPTTAGSNILLLEGMVTVTTGGTLALQIRSSVNGTAVTVLARSGYTFIVS